jgi:hypothetical protein
MLRVRDVKTTTQVPKIGDGHALSDAGLLLGEGRRHENTLSITERSQEEILVRFIRAEIQCPSIPQAFLPLSTWLHPHAVVGLDHYFFLYDRVAQGAWHH